MSKRPSPEEIAVAKAQFRASLGLCGAEGCTGIHSTTNDHPIRAWCPTTREMHQDRSRRNMRRMREQREEMAYGH